MTYLPLARKYRPQTFENLVGQSHVTATLTRAIATGRIGQAYLFTGQRGVGKTSAARILAKCLNCARGPTAAPCQECPSCTAITQGSSLDVIEIDGASNRGIDDIRALREQVKFAPVHGRFRVYIIDEVHQITPDAFNALLKTLEEPPAHAKFIFATTAPQKVPATILSRCQRFDFRRLDAATIVAALGAIGKAERIAAEEPALYAIARAAEGSLRDAEVILEQLVSFCEGIIREGDVTQLLGAVEHEALVAWGQAILDRDAPAALSWLARRLEEGKDVPQLLTGLLMHLRNLLIVRATADAPKKDLRGQLLDVPAEQAARLEEQASRATPEELLLMLQLLTGAYELCRRSPFAQTILELALLKLCGRDSWQSLAQVAQQLDRWAQDTSSGPSAARPSADAPTPRPQEDSSRGVSLEAVAAQWPAVLERLGQRKISLAAYLTETKPLGVHGSRLEIGLPGVSLYQEVVQLPEHLRLMEQTLLEVFGQALSVSYATLPAPDPAPTAAVPASHVVAPTPTAVWGATAPPMPPIVQDIVKLFDATIIPSPPAP